MLPHEAFRHNSAVAAAATSSALVRPHSRQLVPVSSSSSSPPSHVAGSGAIVPKRPVSVLADRTSPIRVVPLPGHLPPQSRAAAGVAAQSATAAQLPPRAASPNRNGAVRILGNTILSPFTVVSSSVEAALRLQGSAASPLRPQSPPRSPQRAASPCPQQPATAGNESLAATLQDVALSLGDSAHRGQLLPPALHPSATASMQAGVVGMEPLRSAFGTTADDVADFAAEGMHLVVAELAPSVVVAADLKRLELGVTLPRNVAVHGVVRAPRIAFSPLDGTGGGVACDVACTTAFIDVDAATAAAAEAVELRFARVVAHVVDVGEVGHDRALHYEVVPDAATAGLLAAPPTLDSLTGDLRLTLARPAAAAGGGVAGSGGGGACLCRIFAWDCAGVDPATGACVATVGSPLLLTIRVARGRGPRVASAAQHHQVVAPRSLGNSSGGGAAVSSGALATAADFDATVSPASQLREAEGERRAGRLFEFPATNPHELRCDDVLLDAERWVAEAAGASPQQQHPQPSRRLVGYSSAPSPPPPPPSSFSAAAAARRPCFAGAMTEMDLLRCGRATQERDRLAGEPVPSVVERAELESKLVERLRSEERRLGSATALELVPLLMRQAQLCAAAGAARQGDAIELLERVARIRMASVRIRSYADIDEADAALEATNSGATAGSPSFAKQSGGDLGFSSVWAAATVDGGDAKLFDAFVQSLSVVATFLKASGRYREAIEFARHALAAAQRASPDGLSASCLRMMTELAVLLQLTGEHEPAAQLLQQCLGRVEMLFGPADASANALRHMLGVCLADKGQFTAAMQAHDTTLRNRQRAAATAEAGAASGVAAEGKGGAPLPAREQPLLLAESHAWSALARAQSGTQTPASLERISDSLESALTLLGAFDAQQQQQQHDAHRVARCGVLAVLARVCALRGDGDRAGQLLLRASDEAASARGFQSVEAALFAAQLAAHRLGERASEAGALKQLQFAFGVVAAALGQHHPFAARCALLLAEARAVDGAPLAVALADRALSSLRQQLAPAHAHVGVAAGVHGRVLMFLRRAPDDRERALSDARAAHAVATLRAPHHTLDELVRLDTALIGAHCRANARPSADLLGALEARLARVREEQGETSARMVEPLQNVAEAFFLCEDYARSHHYLTRALKIADSVNFIFLLGHLLKPAAQLTASALQERNRIAEERIHTSLALALASILFQVAAVFDAQGRAEDAQSTYLQCLAALEISGVVHGLGVVQTLLALAKLLFREGHGGDALAYAERAHSILLEHHGDFVAAQPPEGTAAAAEADAAQAAPPPPQVAPARPAPMHLAAVNDALRVVSYRLRSSGYVLLRHLEGRHRFATYL